jgi:hypothetical protein
MGAARFESESVAAADFSGGIRGLPGKPENRRIGSAKSGLNGTNQKNI